MRAPLKSTGISTGMSIRGRKAELGSANRAHKRTKQLQEQLWVQDLDEVV